MNIPNLLEAIIYMITWSGTYKLKVQILCLSFWGPPLIFWKIGSFSYPFFKKLHSLTFRKGGRYNNKFFLFGKKRYSISCKDSGKLQVINSICSFTV